MTDYSALRRLAHEASETEMGWLDRGWLASIMADAWADYVAAVDPEVVLSLIDEVGRWKNIAANQKDRTEVAIEMAAAYRDERDQLKAENEAMRTALAEAKYRIEQGRVWAGTKWQLTGLHPLGQQKALDAINVAMSQGEQANG